MKQIEKEKDPEQIFISVEAFDAIDSIHEFSEEYKKNKKKMLKQYRKSLYRPARGKIIKAAAALLVAATPVIAVTAANSEIISRIWGTSGRENIEPHKEIFIDEEKGISYTVSYPAREYTDDALDKADELIGGFISYEPVVKEIGDTKLTVLTAAYDGYAAVVAFTLEREGGVNALTYSQVDNESKGAWFSDNAPFWFRFADCYENIFVDLDKSTKDMLYCYDYMVIDPFFKEEKGLMMEIYQRTDSGEGEKQGGTLSIPLKGRINSEAYVNAEGGGVMLSPISLKIDMGIGLGLSPEEVYDPWYIYYVSVNYKDGTSYIVHEHEMEGIHSCRVEMDNAGYTCGVENGIVFVFNRLADTEEVESVVVNETMYTLNSK